MKNDINSKEKRCGVGCWLFKTAIAVIVSIGIAMAIVVFAAEYVVPFWNSGRLHPHIVIASCIFALWLINKIIVTMDENKYQEQRNKRIEECRRNLPEGSKWLAEFIIAP